MSLAQVAVSADFNTAPLFTPKIEPNHWAKLPAPTPCRGARPKDGNDSLHSLASGPRSRAKCRRYRPLLPHHRYAPARAVCKGSARMIVPPGSCHLRSSQISSPLGGDARNLRRNSAGYRRGLAPPCSSPPDRRTPIPGLPVGSLTVDPGIRELLGDGRGVRFQPRGGNS